MRLTFKPLKKAWFRLQSNFMPSLAIDPKSYPHPHSMGSMFCMPTPRHTEAFTLRWQSVHTPLPAGFCFQKKGHELETMAKVISAFPPYCVIR